MKIETPEGRLIAIGDIHGHSGYLRLLIDGIKPQKEDTIIFLGDYIDRGPDSKGVIDEIISLSDKCNVHTILGNHEEMLLGAYGGGKDDVRFWLKFGGVQALESYQVDKVQDVPRDHLIFINKCKDYIETDDFIFVHAGVNPDVDLVKCSGNELRWRSLHNPFKDSETFIRPHFSGKTVICGHTTQNKILDLGFLICIDTGCGVFTTGRLTALDVKSKTIWQVGARNKKATMKSLR